MYEVAVGLPMPKQIQMSSPSAPPPGVVHSRAKMLSGLLPALHGVPAPGVKVVSS